MNVSLQMWPNYLENELYDTEAIDLDLQCKNFEGNIKREINDTQFEYEQKEFNPTVLVVQYLKYSPTKYIYANPNNFKCVKQA